MSSVAIFTDSDASLPKLLSAQHGIGLVPINIHFGGDTLRSGVDIDTTASLNGSTARGLCSTTSAH